MKAIGKHTFCDFSPAGMVPANGGHWINRSHLAAFLSANEMLLRRAYAAAGCPQPWTPAQYAEHRQEFLEFLNQLEKLTPEISTSTP